MHCPKCDSHGSGKFCSNCGAEYPKEYFLYIGKNIDRAVYRIILKPLEDVYDSEDQILDEARHSCWGEDGPIEVEKIERLRSAITDEYIYICANCKEYVSEYTEGKCNGCGEVNWVKRKE
jgi:hypothetical protein